MKKLVLFTSKDRKKIIKFRSGESKFGKHFCILNDTCNIYEQLLKLDVKYVLVGIPENIGMFANLSNTGDSSSYERVINFLLNTQQNEYNNAKDLAILGYLDCTEELNQIQLLDPTKLKDVKKARLLVENLDKYVTILVHDIVKAGKIPIIIGGGQNNAYGIIKGTSLALNKSINTININANISLQKEDGRHNGNAHSYALTEGFLKRLYCFGVHEILIQQTILSKFKKLNKQLRYCSFESVFIRKENKLKPEVKSATEFISSKPFGIDINFSAIEGMASNTLLPTGISSNTIRELVSKIGINKQVKFLHICESAPSKDHKKRVLDSPKLIAYLITDFIRANSLD